MHLSGPLPPRHDGAHATQSGGAGAAKEVHQHGLGLVVGVVGNGDGVGACGAGRLGEEGVAHAAGGVHWASAERGHLAALDGSGDVPGLGCGAHGLGLGSRLGAQAVVEMGHMELGAAVGAQPVKQVEQAERVGATGDGDEQARIRAQQPVGGEEGAKWGEQIAHSIWGWGPGHKPFALSPYVWCRRRGSNPRPNDYEPFALPLSYPDKHA